LTEIVKNGITKTLWQISDLSFRRNILVQVLIVLDFLLSLSPKSKEKLAKSSLPDNLNKSVLYADHLLAEDDVSTLQVTSSVFCDLFVIHIVYFLRNGC